MVRKHDVLAPRRVPKQERARSRVDEILGAARALLLESGVSGLTTARIAASAGVPVGSVYQYFPNKKAIVLALYDAYLAPFRAALEEFERNGPYEAGWEIFCEQLAIAVNQSDVGGEVEEVLLVAARAFPELQEHAARHEEFVVETLVRMLRRLGSRWSGTKLRRLARYLYLLNEGALHYRRAVQPSAREVAEWERRTAVAVLGMCFAD